MKKFRQCVAAATAGVLLASLPVLALADDIDLGNDKPVAGMAWDDEQEFLFLTDPDAPGAIAMVDASGAAVGELTFSGQPESVQGLDLVDDLLHIADIGDVDGTREFITVFAVPAADGQQRYRAWDFQYPDGAKDAQAFLISGRGRFYFITGGDDPGIYASQLDPSRESINTLFRAADAPEGVTDATFLDDGATMLVRTGDGVVLIDAFSWATTDATVYSQSPPDEAITQFGDGRMLVGGNGYFRDEPLPSGDQTVTPSLQPSPTPTPTEPTPGEPTPTGEPEPEPGDENVTSDVSRSGTLLAIGGAAAVAILAGVVVFVRKD